MEELSKDPSFNPMGGEEAMEDMEPSEETINNITTRFLADEEISAAIIASADTTAHKFTMNFKHASLRKYLPWKWFKSNPNLTEYNIKQKLDFEFKHY